MTEHQEQVAVVKWFDHQYPRLRGKLFAVPNGGQRHPAVAAKLKAEGVRRGVPDLWLPVRTDCFAGLVIELKVKGGRLSPEQADWLDHLTGEGYMAVVCVGADAAMATISGYLSCQSLRV